MLYEIEPKPFSAILEQQQSLLHTMDRQIFKVKVKAKV